MYTVQLLEHNPFKLNRLLAMFLHIYMRGEGESSVQSKSS